MNIKIKTISTKNRRQGGDARAIIPHLTGLLSKEHLDKKSTYDRPWTRGYRKDRSTDRNYDFVLSVSFWGPQTNSLIQSYATYSVFPSTVNMLDARILRRTEPLSATDRNKKTGTRGTYPPPHPPFTRYQILCTPC